MDRKEDRREGIKPRDPVHYLGVSTPHEQRDLLDRLDGYLEGTGRALRQDQTYDDLKTSAICLCNAMQNLVTYLKERDR